jgi:twitching motility protein PilT
MNENQKNSLMEHAYAAGTVKASDQDTVRFQVSLHKTGCTGVFRVLPNRAPTVADLQLPQVVSDLAQKRTGLILVCGPEGHGKWSTVFSLLETINQQKSLHIATFETALKYIAQPVKSRFSQYELPKYDGRQLISMATGLAAGCSAFDLGFDKNIMDAALRLVQHGQLVFISAPSHSIAECLLQIRSFYSHDEWTWVKQQLATHLQGAIGQRLAVGLQNGLVLAQEVLVNTPQVKSALLDQDVVGLEEIMKNSGEKTGMRTMNQSLLQNLIRRKIDIKSAFEHSPVPEELDTLLNKVGI